MAGIEHARETIPFPRMLYRLRRYLRMLKETVTKSLTDRFGESVTLNPTSTSFAGFTAKHPAVGNVSIAQDGNELIVSVGDITHGHFASYEDNLSEKEHETVIALELIDFLADLFDDKILLFKARWGGGWSRVEYGFKENFITGRRTWFNWSGPIDPKDVLSHSD